MYAIKKTLKAGNDSKSFHRKPVFLAANAVPSPF